MLTCLFSSYRIILKSSAKSTGTNPCRQNQSTSPGIQSVKRRHQSFSAAAQSADAGIAFTDNPRRYTDFASASGMKRLTLDSGKQKDMPYARYIIIACALAAVSCTETYTEIGNNRIEVRERVIIIDTCSVDISNIILDSVKTSGGNTVYAGCRESSYWGKTAMSSYLTFKATEDYDGSSTPEYEARAIFDSLTLYMVPDSTFCGDTLLPMTLQVYKLSETVELDDNGELYGHAEFSHELPAIAEKTFYPHPLADSPVEIRLSDELGKTMLEKIINEDEEMDDDEDFREYFKGLLLKSSDPTGSIMGFEGKDSLCMMKLYYRTQDYAEPEEHVLEFQLDSTYLFTHVESDFSGTPVEVFTDSGDEVSSTLTENMSFVSGMCGICTKIGFPYLNNLRSIWDHCRAASAELVIHPAPGSYCKQNYSSIPPSLNLYIMDENNISTGGAITGLDGETLQSGSLTYDEMMFPEETYYTYDITSFINGQFGKIGVNRKYLQMIDPNYGYTLDELVIPDRFAADCQIKLIIKLALYDE